MAVPTPISPQGISASESYRHLRFPQVFEAAAIGIALCHFDGRILEGNAALARILRLTPADLAGLNPWDFHAADSAGSRLLAELLHGQRDSFATERLYQRKDSSEFWGHLTVTLARDAQHSPAFLVVLLDDVTERKHLEEKLRQAEKMEIVGRFTAGIAHDFNNLLTGFLLYCDVLLSELEPNHRLRQYVEQVRLAGEQGAALTQQLLAISRKHEPKLRAVQLNDVVSSAQNLLRHMIPEPIELVTSLDPAAEAIFADPAQLSQVLLNLALNARDAIRQGGKIQISTRATRFPGSATADRPQPAVSLVVEDNGCGMTAETRNRLFEPFFTTKQPGEGTGMGMATVQRIVNEGGGQIEIASEPNQGTRIEVFFPKYETPAVTESSGDRVSALSDKPVPRDAQIARWSDHPITRSNNSPTLNSGA
jgi:PAS domain S-box-containing protein